MVVLRRSLCDRPATDFGGAKLSLLMEKQHNRGQDGAGAAILSANPEPGEEPYWIAKSASATPLADVLGAIARRKWNRTSDMGLQASEVLSPKPEVEKIFLGHLRYATFGKNEVAFCHPFVHEASELEHTLLLAGNFNLTNAHELFEEYSRHGSFPTSKSDGYLVCELIAHELGKEGLPTSDFGLRCCSDVGSPMSEVKNPPIATALSKALGWLDDMLDAVKGFSLFTALNDIQAECNLNREPKPFPNKYAMPLCILNLVLKEHGLELEED